jgi:hypothetical protein
MQGFFKKEKNETDDKYRYANSNPKFFQIVVVAFNIFYFLDNIHINRVINQDLEALLKNIFLKSRAFGFYQVKNFLKINNPYLFS